MQTGGYFLFSAPQKGFFSAVLRAVYDAIEALEMQRHADLMAVQWAGMLS